MAKWEQLIAARECKHLSQLEAAERVNVGLVTYQRWEVGRSKPQPHHMRQLYEVFGALLDHPEHEMPSQETVAASSPTTPVMRDSWKERLFVESVEEIDEPQAFIAADMTTHLWSLAFKHYPTCNDRRDAIRQTIKEFDTMNTNNKNYQITRREALCSLATLPMITLGLTTPGRTLQPAQYGTALAHCTASLEACRELSKSSEASDLALASKSILKYLPTLETIANNSSQYRKEAAELAAQGLFLKATLSVHLATPKEAINYAKQSILYGQESGNATLQIAALRRLAWIYYCDRQPKLALEAALEAQHVAETSKQAALSPPLQSCVYGTSAKYQALNGRKDDAFVSLKHAHQILSSSNEESSYYDEFRLIQDDGTTHYFSGKHTEAMDSFRQIIDENTLTSKIAASSERSRIEVINYQTMTSLKLPKKDKELSVKLWTTGIQGAKAIQSEQRFNEAVLAYEIMEALWSTDKDIIDLRGLIVHW